MCGTQLTSLPANPNVVEILEEYVRNFGFGELATLRNLAQSKDENSTCVFGSGYGQTTYMQKSYVGWKRSKSSEEPDIGTPHLQKAFQQIQLCKEVTEGAKIMFDFYLHQVLLYEEEFAQFENICRETHLSEFR